MGEHLVIAGARVSARRRRHLTTGRRPTAADVQTILTGPDPHRARPPAAAAKRRKERESHLVVLAAGDAICCLFGYALCVVWLLDRAPANPVGFVATIALLTSVGVWIIRWNGLWMPRINGLRSVELAGIAKAAFMMVGAALLFEHFATLGLQIEGAVGAAVSVTMALGLWRAVYRHWLREQRTRGRFMRSAIIVGTDLRAVEMARLLDTYPEEGVRVVGIIGSQYETHLAGLSHLYLGDYTQADDVLGVSNADIVILSSTDLNPAQLNLLARDEQDRGRAVYLDPGLAGIDSRRVKSAPLAHEPVLFLEAPRFSRFDDHVKRAFDVLGAALVLVLAAPIMAAVAVLVKRDGGPVFFRQRRVGRDGEQFGMYKFRSMVVDSEQRFAEVKTANERSGPLFKMASDPRITRVGRFIRATSLDELPQLLNVIKGEMSLVGPRPALAAEVEQFPDALRGRDLVRPGITGLWQVEARDNPRFEAYHQLDLYYVENWSLSLDVVIMLATVEQMLFRPFSKLFSRSSHRADGGAVDATTTGDDGTGESFTSFDARSDAVQPGQQRHDGDRVGAVGVHAAHGVAVVG